MLVKEEECARKRAKAKIRDKQRYTRASIFPSVAESVVDKVVTDLTRYTKHQECTERIVCSPITM